MISTIAIGDTVLLMDKRKVKILEVYVNGYLYKDEQGNYNIADKSEVKRKIRVKNKASRE